MGVAVTPVVKNARHGPRHVPQKVLLLGGESSSSAGLTDLLREDGFQVRICKDMRDTLRELAGSSILVVEQNASHERFASFLAEVRGLENRVRIFVITPYGDTALRLEEAGVKIAGCFPMPLVYEDLVEALGKKMKDERENEVTDAAVLTADLIARLDKPGPRYTSYPTAPVFAANLPPRTYENALSTYLPGSRPLSLYVHLPFCEAMCTYCACNVVVRRNIEKAAAPYVTRLLAEARLVAGQLEKGSKLSEIHLGGGTPNYLPRAEIERLMEGLECSFAVEDDATRSVEVDPRHFEEDQLVWLAGLGFNRVSFGIQDVEKEVQIAIGRQQTFESTARAVHAARAAGFESINMDFVYGLPAQTRVSFSRTVEQVIELEPDRLAVFSFAYVPSHKPTQRKLDIGLALTGLDKAQLLVDAVNKLTDAGYTQVGMDHFAVPEDALARSQADGTLHRNFQGYVPGPEPDLIGLGVTAIGDITGVLVQNHRDIGDWEEAVDAGRLPIARGWKRTFDDEVRRRVILSLMCLSRLSFQELSQRFGIEHDRYFQSALPHLSRLTEQGLIRPSADGYEVTALGRFFVRNIALVYDAYLPRMSGTFSRTV